MPSLAIPKGSQISQINRETVEIKVPNTKFWIVGEQEFSKLWNVYLVDPETNHKEIIRKEINTKLFALFSNVILKTPFPYQGKRAENSVIVKRFIKSKTKTIKCNQQH